MGMLLIKSLNLGFRPPVFIPIEIANSKLLDLIDRLQKEKKKESPTTARIRYKPVRPAVPP